MKNFLNIIKKYKKCKYLLFFLNFFLNVEKLHKLFNKS
jgi:hypothetical protein